MDTYLKRLMWVLTLGIMISATAHASTVTPKYSTQTISSAPPIADLIPLTTGSGDVWGLKCIFPSNAVAAGASVNIIFTVDGGTATSFIIDPTDLELDSAGRFLSGWIPMEIEFTSSIQIQLDNNNSPATVTTVCSASWQLN